MSVPAQQTAMVERIILLLDYGNLQTHKVYSLEQNFLFPIKLVDLCWDNPTSKVGNHVQMPWAGDKDFSQATLGCGQLY